MSKQLQPHPLAETIPGMTKNEYQVLKADIENHGLREPIILLDGKILDGRNRYRALIEIGMPISDEYFSEFDPKSDGEDPASFVRSRNLKRRHLKPEQYAVLAYKLVQPHLRGKGRPKKGADEKFPVARNILPAKQITAEVADEVGATPGSIRDVKSIANKAPELLPEIEQGRLSIASGLKLAKAKVEPEEYDVAMGKLEKVVGAEFDDALNSGAIRVDAAEVVALAGKDGKLIKRYQAGLKAGLSWRRLKVALENEITHESRIRHLLDACEATEDKQLSILVDGWRIQACAVTSRKSSKEK
jgi:ParB-like chromosome segregation protein Spo0J